MGGTVWSEIARVYAEPGKPMQNGYVERFNRTFREDVLDAYLFTSISQYQIVADEIIADYNNHHPHESLGGQSPKSFGKRKYKPPATSIRYCEE